MTVHTLPEPFTKDDILTFKQVLLPIILLKELVNVFKKNRGIDPLKKNITAYNEKKGVYKTGSLNSVIDLLKIDSGETLIKIYNKTLNRPDPSELLNEAGAALPKFGNHYQTVNHFVFCQYFLTDKLPHFYTFTFVLVDEQGKKHASIDEFIASDQPLKSCQIKSPDNWAVREDAPTPSTPKSDNDDLAGGKSLGDTNEPVDEHCIAYFLNDKFQIIENKVTITWTKDRSKLLNAVMQQQEQDKSLVYESINETIVQEPGGAVFMTLRGQKISRSVYFQIAIQSEAVKEQRAGSFSAIGHRVLSSTSIEPISVCGKFILATLTKEHEVLDRQTVAQIHYRLQEQLLIETPNLREKHNQTQSRWEPFAGNYVCTYMRLAHTDGPRLQTSFVELFADGRATLTQFQSVRTEGWGRFTLGSEGPDKIWLFFGRNDELGQARVRFLLRVPPKGATLKGIFTSETLKSERIVSGRMLMKKLGSREAWPRTHLNVPYQQVLYAHVGTDKDLAFFNGQETDSLNDDGSRTMSDGPYWASIANRLSFPSALRELNKFYKEEVLPASSTPNQNTDNEELTTNQIPFSDGCFYYYVFKEHEDEDFFLIERNFILFNKDGTVTIKAGENQYIGQAYYDHRTLKISLSHSKNGFLDAYFDLSFTESDDTAAIRVLYGASLWRSKNRIEAKAVVLSRLGTHPLDPITRVFKFLNADDPNYALQMQQLIEEDSPVAGAGVIAYLRGTLNRFHHSSVHAPSGGFRPRDAHSREPHFLVACYYALTLRGLSQPIAGEQVGSDTPNKAVRNREQQQRISQVRAGIDEIKRHLRIAHVYGYACSFGNLQINLDELISDSPSNKKAPDLHLLQSVIEQQYDEHFTNAEKNIRKRPEILKRLVDITNEQLTVRAAFAEGGLFYDDKHPELRVLGNRLWPDLIPPVTTSKPG